MKPLLPEHDLRAERFLLKADHVYHIELVAKDGIAQFLRDGEVVFTFKDPSPLTEGWFGIRTVDATIEISQFRVEAPPSESHAAQEHEKSGAFPP